MPKVLYGIWNGKVLDHRDSTADADDFPLDSIDDFDAGNPLEAIVSNAGFLVFNPTKTLASVLADYYKTVRSNSCGRCTPCRNASVLIDEALQSLLAGQGNTVDWDAVLAAAEQMDATSLCGIGRTSAKAIIGALRYFRDELLRVQSPTFGASYGVVTSSCMEACPDHVNIPRYMDFVRDGDTDRARAVILKRYPMVSTCGRVCVRPCERACRRNALEGALAIKDVKRYIAEHAAGSVAQVFCGSAHVDLKRKKTAVIGAGPSGLNCAYHLLLKGFPVDIYDADSQAGGMALRGIPPYRLPKDILQSETDAIQELGGRFFFQKKLGRDFTVADLKKQYDAVFLGIGCAKGAYLGLPDEDTTIKGYRNGIDFLLDIERAVSAGKMPEIQGDIAVVGCGNVAMDCCRTARRVTKGKVHLIYRRTLKEAPADREEIEAAKEEGVEFHFLTNPIGVESEDGILTGVRLTKMHLTEPDARGRMGVAPTPGSEYTLTCQTLVAAIGQKIEKDVIEQDSGITFGRRGNVEVDAVQMTGIAGVFAGGDCATGPASLVGALAQGERAAHSIAAYLTGRSLFNPRDRASEIIGKLKLVWDKVDPCKTQPRLSIHPVDAAHRRETFKPADTGFTDEEARKEAARCMRCYRIIRFYTEKPIPNTAAD